MRLILGFGETESKIEQKMQESIFEKVESLYCELGCDYMTSEVVDSFTDWIKGISSQSIKDDEAFKNAEEYPTRYSCFWVTVLHDASHIVTIIKWHHTNRRHPYSPDGWALMTNEQLVHVDSWEAGRKKRKMEKAA